MSNKIPQEEWTPLPFMEGEHALSKIEYNATDLLVELDSFKEKRVAKIVFANVFSYRVTIDVVFPSESIITIDGKEI